MRKAFSLLNDMPQPLVTVIMAVYNAEAYLRRCLDSLQAQTLKDFDVILVDDGSTDQSLAIAKEYADKDNRFRVYHKENGGVSSARQYGIERLAESGGKYSIHLDPDDWVEPQMLERLYAKAEETGADMVICDYYRNTKDKQELMRQNPKSEDPKVVINAIFKGLYGSLWNKMIRSSCYGEASAKFPENLNCCEDLYVNVCLLLKMEKVAYLPEAFYHYDCQLNCNALTRNNDSSFVNFTRTEVIKRCREKLPDDIKGWQFHFFEAKMAFCIMEHGSMADGDFKLFFNSIPVSLLLHRYCWRPFVPVTLLAVHGPISYRKAMKIFDGYRVLRSLVC